MLPKTDELEILIGLLAEGDALHEAIRGPWDSHHAAAIGQARQVFAANGLPIRAPRGSDAEQKRAERMHDSLEEAGLVTFRREHGRRSHVKLADAVDWRLRRLCCWSDWSEMLVVMLAVAAHTAAAHTNAGFVGDWSLAGLPLGAEPDGRAKSLMLQVEEAALPALVRGLLTSWSDIHGAVGYRLTDAGRRFLDAPPAAPDLSGIDYDTERNAQYIAALLSARAALRTISPARELAIPLGAGNWPGDGAPPIPSIFDRRGRVRTPAGMVAAIRRNVQTNQKEAAR
jgi:hypothetical protein